MSGATRHDRPAARGPDDRAGARGPADRAALRGPNPLARQMLTTAILAAAVFLFLLFYAGGEPRRLEGIAKREAAALAERRARLLPLAEIIFQAHCAECHGPEGEGSKKAPALRSKSFLDAASDEMLTETIVEGRPGTDMKPWGTSHGGPFGPNEVEGLVAFIRSWQATAPGGAEDPRRGEEEGR